MRTSNTGLTLIKHFESLHDGDLSKIDLQPKQDPIGIWTAGFGHALKKPNGEWIRDYSDIERYCPEFLNLTTEEAEQLLSEDLVEIEEEIESLNLDINQPQFDAIVSFSYNCGFDSFLKSTLLRRIRANDTMNNIEAAFLMWNKSSGKVLPGLTFRRKSEALLFNTGILKFFN